MTTTERTDVLRDDPSTGFAPIAREDARVLILGTLPGQASLAAQQYYAHPRNAFWRIMQAMLGVEGSYAERAAGLMAGRIALWDVLRSSIRPGSMDADIRLETALVNDFGGFFEAHPHVRLVCFNGRKAEDLFEKLVDRAHFAAVPRFERLPSTSPAFASMSLSKKLEAWRSTIEPEVRVPG